MVLAGCAVQGQCHRPLLLAHSRHADACAEFMHELFSLLKKPKTSMSQVAPDGWISGCGSQLPHTMAVMAWSSWTCSAWRMNPARACWYLQGSHQEVRAKLFTAVHEGTMRHNSWNELKKEVWTGCKKKLSLWRQSGNGRACPERLCHLCPWRFSRPDWVETEQPHLTSELTLLWARGWSRVCWGSLPTWITF